MQMLIGIVIKKHTHQLLKQNEHFISERVANNSSHAGLYAFTLSNISNLMHESHTCKRYEKSNFLIPLPRLVSAKVAA